MQLLEKQLAGHCLLDPGIVNQGRQVAQGKLAGREWAWRLRECHGFSEVDSRLKAFLQ